MDQNTTWSGPRFGLQLTLDIDQDQYFNTETAGVVVMVHDPSTMPFPEDDAISIAPGQAAFIGVKMVKIQCTIHVSQ